MEDSKSLKVLGKSLNDYNFDYDKSSLDAIQKQFTNRPLIKIVAPEFTTLCPVTKQPDFATIYINYVPNEYIVESKSLKVYLFSFRNIGMFHEDVVDRVLKDLVNLLDPLYIEVIGAFNARGGIAITPFANYAKDNSEYISWVDERKKNFNMR